MARTWQGTLPAAYSDVKHEGAIEYRIRRSGSSLAYEVELPERAAVIAPVEVVLGGPRLGLSFLARVSAIGGLRLEREPLVEARYLAGAPGHRLTLSPGFPTETPVSYETALGRVLNPDFEVKCFRCHGAPRAGVQEAGVRCEHCHGPGAAHIQTIGKGAASGIVQPARMTNAGRIAQCGLCHADGRNLADPMPEDLLISDQADALVQSECYIQSGEGLSCSTCHNPHADAAAGASRYTQACLSCHSQSKQSHAAICPVNARDNCTTCHMKALPLGAFRMVDHWIRVHPEDAPAARRDPARRGTLRPRRVFLRLMAVPDGPKAEQIHKELVRGAPFFKMAQTNSAHESALSGGFLGAKWMQELEPEVAGRAATLAPGEISPVIQSGNQYLILQRLPRDFRWSANRLYEEALKLKAAGQMDAALAKNQQALETYPHFLRALVLLGSTLGERGDVGRGVTVLEHAARLYPEDPGAQLNLGIIYGAAGRPSDEIRAYERAIEKEPGVISAYMNLGAALLASGEPDRAIAVFRKGLDVNPLSAALYYNLSVVLEQQGKSDGARRAMALAEAINPEFVRSQKSLR